MAQRRVSRSAGIPWKGAVPKITLKGFCRALWESDRMWPVAQMHKSIPMYAFKYGTPFGVRAVPQVYQGRADEPWPNPWLYCVSPSS